MAIQDIRKRVEDIELITNYDLVTAAHALMDGIDLDVASSKTANTYVEAAQYFTLPDDGLNAQQWHGSAFIPTKRYLFGTRKMIVGR